MLLKLIKIFIHSVSGMYFIIFFTISAFADDENKNSSVSLESNQNEITILRKESIKRACDAINNETLSHAEYVGWIKVFLEQLRQRPGLERSLKNQIQEAKQQGINTDWFLKLPVNEGFSTVGQIAIDIPDYEKFFVLSGEIKFDKRIIAYIFVFRIRDKNIDFKGVNLADAIRINNEFSLYDYWVESFESPK